ncbi:MAG: ABC transporter ATP-binding protein [Gammaproteobacteria bacterium]|nr:ABC transporter ATP-binding protein [Gammaproteobacteria bacterium]
MTDVPVVGETTRTDDLNFRRVVHIFVRTWPFIRPAVKHLVIFVAVSVAIAVYSAVLVFIITGLMNGGIVAGRPLGQLHVAIYGLDPAVYVNVESLSDEARLSLCWPVILSTTPLLLVAVGGALILLYYGIWIFQGINQRMRVTLIDRLQAQSLAFHASAQTGDAIYRVYQDSAMVTSIIRAIFLEPLMFMGRLLFGVAVIAAFDPWLALMLAATVFPILYLGLKFSSRLRIAFRRARETNSRLTSWIQESVLGVRVVKATLGEAAREQSFRDHSMTAFDAAFRARTLLTVMGILAFAIIAATVLATQSTAAMYANSGAETFARNLLLGFGFAVWNLGSFTAATGRIGDGLGSINALISIWGRAQDMAIGLGRVFEILDLEPDIEDAPGARAMADLREDVVFTGVAFGYQPGRPVLAEVDLAARRGTITAVVGPTGAGKSTLMALLLRLADPDSGRVEIDGSDIRTLTVDSLRANIALATQENVLFSDTVLENIRYAAPGASRAAAVAAAKVACADEFISALPQGYDTPLGERAAKLSSGQRQRLVIARAVIKDAPILILDEPTAALDAETELKVLDNLKAWGRDRCIFLVTHRLSTVRRADRVAYLRDGRILSWGGHDELMAEDGAYARFVNAETHAVQIAGESAMADDE